MERADMCIVSRSFSWHGQPKASSGTAPSPYDRNMELHGAGTVVTGASGGIGEALARRFHHLGAWVVVSDIAEAGITALAAELNAKRPHSALAVVADVATESGNQ